jgi:tRNA-splicing ligase RtcB
MGDGTWLLRGLGCIGTLASSAHGAGRKLSRREARSAAPLDHSLRVVGPIDPHDPIMHGRHDIMAEVLGRLKEEAPGAYKPIESIIEPMENAGMVARVAKVRPILTVKG